MYFTKLWPMENANKKDKVKSRTRFIDHYVIKKLKSKTQRHVKINLFQFSILQRQFWPSFSQFSVFYFRYNLNLNDAYDSSVVSEPDRGEKNSSSYFLNKKEKVEKKESLSKRVIF